MLCSNVLVAQAVLDLVPTGRQVERLSICFQQGIVLLDYQTGSGQFRQVGNQHSKSHRPAFAFGQGCRVVDVNLHWESDWLGPR